MLIFRTVLLEVDLDSFTEAVAQPRRMKILKKWSAMIHQSVHSVEMGMAPGVLP